MLRKIRNTALRVLFTRTRPRRPYSGWCRWRLARSCWRTPRSRSRRRRPCPPPWWSRPPAGMIWFDLIHWSDDLIWLIWFNDLIHRSDLMIWFYDLIDSTPPPRWTSRPWWSWSAWTPAPWWSRCRPCRTLCKQAANQRILKLLLEPISAECEKRQEEELTWRRAGWAPGRSPCSWRASSGRTRGSRWRRCRRRRTRWWCWAARPRWGWGRACASRSPAPSSTSCRCCPCRTSAPIKIRSIDLIDLFDRWFDDRWFDRWFDDWIVDRWFDRVIR